MKSKHKLKREKMHTKFLSKNMKGRPGRRCEDNIGKDLTEMGWIHVSQERNHWRALVNKVMEFRVP
jgi:hypothetical protein